MCDLLIGGAQISKGICFHSAYDLLFLVPRVTDRPDIISELGPIKAQSRRSEASNRPEEHSHRWSSGSRHLVASLAIQPTPILGSQQVILVTETKP